MRDVPARSQSIGADLADRERAARCASARTSAPSSWCARPRGWPAQLDVRLASRSTSRRPQLQRLPDARAQRILRSAEARRGARRETATLAGGDVAAAVVDVRARAQLLAGRRRARRRRSVWRPWRRARWRASWSALCAATSTSSRSRCRRATPRSPAARARAGSRRGRRSAGAGAWRRYAWRAAICAAITAAGRCRCSVLRAGQHRDAVPARRGAASAVRYRPRAGGARGLRSTCAAFDFFFVPPRFSFAVSDVQYLVTFGVMLVVGAGHRPADARAALPGRASRPARSARARAVRDDARTVGRADGRAGRRDRGALRASRVRAPARCCWWPTRTTASRSPCRRLAAGIDPGVAHWAFDHARGRPGIGTDTLPAQRHALPAAEGADAHARRARARAAQSGAPGRSRSSAGCSTPAPR